MIPAPGFNTPLPPAESAFPDFPVTGGLQGGNAIDPLFRGDDGTFLDALTIDLRRDLEHARSSKSNLNTRIERYRQYYAMDRDPPAYVGAPNHRTPYIRSKVSGSTAHMRSALDQDPMFVVRPYTKDASQHKGPLETLMERELDRSQTRRQIWRGIQEAGLTGTGVMQLSVAQVGEEFIVQGRLVYNEDFFVIPPGNEDVARVSTFLRYEEPYHVMRQRVRDGEYDEEKVEDLRPHVGRRNPTYAERKDQVTVPSDQGENTPYELYECYYRWGHEDLGDDSYTLWRVIFSLEQGVIGAIRSPYLDAFDAPPYVPLRVMPVAGYFWGESYAQVLEGIQHVMDWSYNSLIAYDQFAMTPITFVDADSEIYASLQDVGLAPGQIIPTRGAPKESVYSLTPPPAREPYQMMQALRSLGEDATFSDLQLNGMPTTTVRSATEISAIQGAASKKLSENLSNLSDDLSTFARMYWALLYQFKIKPKGVLPVFQGSDQYLIAAQEIEGDELLGHMASYMQMQGMAPPDEATRQMMVEQLRSQGTELFIASARRDDVEWQPNGAKLVADRLMHANKMERLIGGLLPALSMARQDRAAWHIMKEYLISLDLHNWEDFLPAQPPEDFMDPQQMAQFTQMMQQTKQGGGVG